MSLLEGNTSNLFRMTDYLSLLDGHLAFKKVPFGETFIDSPMLVYLIQDPFL